MCSKPFCFPAGQFALKNIKYWWNIKNNHIITDKRWGVLEKLYRLLDEGFEEMVEIRRHLHQYPELSFEEVETPKLIADYHEKLGHEVRMGKLLPASPSKI